MTNLAALYDEIREIAKRDPLRARRLVMKAMEFLNDARDIEAENEAYARAAGYPNLISMIHELAHEEEKNQ